MKRMSQPIIPQDQQGLRFLLSVRRDPLAFFSHLMEKHGPYTWIKLEGLPVLVLNDATGIGHVLQSNAKNYQKTPFTKKLSPILGKGIFLSDGARWMKQRQESASVFASGNFDDMATLMGEATAAMLDRWSPRVARGESLDITFEMTALTLDILLRTLFHESQQDLAKKMQQILGLLLRDAENRIWSPFNIPQSLIYRTPQFRLALGFLENVIEELVAARRANKAYPQDLLSHLVANYGFSAEDQATLRDQIMSFLLAGHETTAHSLSWSLYQLARHPLQRQTMIDEVDQTLRGARPTYKTVKDLQYTRQVFDEALRLYPPVWTMSRQALDDDYIPLDDGHMVPLPKNACVMMSGYTVHRRMSYWQDPEAFDPNRFSADALANRSPFAWFPFGAGQRLCLGFRFAQIESIIALAMINQRYTMTLIPGQNIVPKPIITLRPNGPILFTLKERSQAQEPALPLLHPKPTLVHDYLTQRAIPTICPFHTQEPSEIPHQLDTASK